jgi:hypothetical protein
MPVENAVVLTVMFVPEVPTVRPETMVFPALSRNSASAAVPLADGVAVRGTPSMVATLEAMLTEGFGRVTVASTPVAPDKLAVPMTSWPKPAPPSTDWPETAAVKVAANLALAVAVA